MAEELMNFDRIHWQFKPVFGATENLSKNVVNIHIGDFPEFVKQIGKALILDSIYCMLQGSKKPEAKKLMSFLELQGGIEECTYFDKLNKSNRYNCSLYNGSLIGLSGDDCAPDYMHVEGAVIPAVFAVAEKEFLEGNRILEATILGIETMLRLKAAAKTIPYNRALDPTSTFGPFGAAVAVSKLLGMDVFMTENSLSLCASQAAGAQRSSVKNNGDVGKFHPGFAASYGVRAVYMAKEGLSGPRNILEGNMGFFECVSGLYDDNKTPRYDVNLVNKDFGDKWLIEDLNISWDGISKKLDTAVVDTVARIENMDSMSKLIGLLK